MTFSAEIPKTLDDFVLITGLKKKWAKECFDRFGGYAPAMASFAQSYTSIPEEYFEDKNILIKNTDNINTELREIYKMAREIKAKMGKEDKEVWAAYYAQKTTVPSSQMSFKSATPTAPPLNPFTNIGSSPSGVAPKHADPVLKPSGGVTFNFGFGSAPSTTGTSTKLSSVFGDFNQSSKESKPREKPSKTVKHCEPSHCTGSFLSMPLFWEEEVVEPCPLLNLNHGFLEENKSLLRERLSKWVSKASFYRQPVKYVEIEDEDEETIRVIIKDAERTFFHPDHRKKFVAFLSSMFYEFEAYGQAMSYLTGICLLVLDEEETASILRMVSKEYISGHWAAEAIGFATSAWVVEHFMKQLFPDVAEHLQNLKFWPDTYLQKILTGLCIHVLHFREMFEFLDLFMVSGFKFLIKFCLAIVEHFRLDLLQIKSTTEANEVYEIMRLDSKVADIKDIRAILKRAPSINLGEEENSIDCIRMAVYNKHVEPRVQRAPKTEAFEPCIVCNERKPKWWNDDMGALCDECKETIPDLTFVKY